MKRARSCSILAAALATMLGCGGEGGDTMADARNDNVDAANAGSDEELAAQLCQLDYGCAPDRWASEQQCADGVMTTLENAASAASCYQAARDLFVCMSSLSCTELEEYWAKSTPTYPCQAENDALQPACNEGD